jgi:hypothetical protein
MTITGSYRDEDGTVVSSIVWALLVLLHSDCKWHQGGPNWAAWANGNSPYELALDAVCEKFGIEFDIEWKANCNDPVGVTIRRKEEQHCSDLRAQDTNQTATGEMRSAMKMICVEAKATPKRDKAIDDVVQKYPELWPQNLGEWEFNGKPVHSQYSYINWNEEHGWTFIDIEVRDDSKASKIAADLATVGGCHVKVMDEIEYHSEQMGEAEGSA